MRAHGRKLAKLQRPTGHRMSLLRNQLTSLLKHEEITTTVTKAKALRRFADWFVTLTKQGSQAARRRSGWFVTEDAVAEKAFSELPQRFALRQGGYTTWQKLGHRQGDGAPIARIALMDNPQNPYAKEVPLSDTDGIYRRGFVDLVAKEVARGEGEDVDTPAPIGEDAGRKTLRSYRRELWKLMDDYDLRAVDAKFSMHLDPMWFSTDFMGKWVAEAQPGESMESIMHKYCTSMMEEDAEATKSQFPGAEHFLKEYSARHGTSA